MVDKVGERGMRRPQRGLQGQKGYRLGEPYQIVRPTLLRRAFRGRQSPSRDRLVSVRAFVPGLL